MPSPKLSNKYKGMPFGDISKDIESKYKDRFDPISRRGLMAEMTSLRDAQEFERQKEAARQELQQMLQQQQTNQMVSQPMQQPIPQPMVTPQVDASNMGVVPQLPQQDMGTFQHSASQSYNQQFAFGGNMDYAYGGSINIDPAKRGTFKAQATRMGMSVQEAADAILNAKEGKYSPEMRRKANFAKNFAKAYGGTLDYFTGGFMENEPLLGTQQNPMAPTETDWLARYTAPPTEADIINRLQTSVRSGGMRTMDDILGARIAGSIQAPAQETAAFVPSQQEGINVQGINPLRFAPIASNLIGMLSARRAPSMQTQMSRMGFPTRVNENLARVNPRQTQFGNVDMSQIERGIMDQARAFTGANVNMTGGQSGQFMANELANQANVMNAIANARMQAQGMDRQTQAMNAQEQARIDAALAQQAAQQAALRGQNIGLGMQMADIDMRNLGAFNTFRNQQLAGLAQNLGNIGRETDQMQMIANALGYTSMGDYTAGQRLSFLEQLLGTRNPASKASPKTTKAKSKSK